MADTHDLRTAHRGVTDRPARVVLLGRKPFPNQFSIERVFEGVRARLPSRFDVRVVTSSYPSKGLVNRLRSVWEARAHQGDVTHVTGDVHYVDLLLDRKRTVLTVHDTELLDRAPWLKRLIYTWWWLRLPVWRAAVVTVPSEATRDDLLRIVRSRPSKVRVIPNSVGDAFHADLRPFAADRPTVLMIGTAPNKNLERAIAALAGLPCRAVIVGALDDVLRRALSAAGVDHTNLVDLDGEAVARCYRDCDLLLFVSTKEGFGLPILEAQATGRPVITSDRPPFREVAGTGACLVDCHDVAAIRAGLRRVMHDSGYREALVAAGFRNVERFDPGEVTDQYAAVYDELISRRAGRRAR
jgi:glycosyltransferase involved in cell wall biosynthesis